ncbi:50S ribosomal protein L10e [candidate division MSBL1 archaeon SCGC-AAA259I09]|uniref:Large ribosomal subunit protein uL16 n=2 Tax=candidate division MSBL1 TaxID=215777 RepID=A0A133UW25_9EURY|nr:50S ribosomal protein L10e [candidate division MSBL1 archaeon SCGC-AAA259I07]KXA98395.1 50S ribosomal protein L10e [candidate division MSBL1 archaeon SCGC-AAA259I09]
MPEKPASAYREQKGPAYTRKEYITGIPGSRITFYERGDPNTDFPIKIALVSKEKGQIRHTALESARVSANRYMMKKAGDKNYYLKLKIYPHQILRENPMALGAGADRISDGMRKAFGRPVALAARVSEGQEIIVIETTEEFYGAGKEALRRGKMKLPLPGKVTLKKGVDVVSS